MDESVLFYSLINLQPYYDTNLKKICLTTIAHTVKKLLLIIDIIVHILVKKQPIFFQRIIDMNAHVEHITKYICVGVRMGAEKIM